MRIYCCLVSASLWNDTETEYDLIATAEHEGRHCEQFRKAQSNNPQGNVYRMLAEENGGIESEISLDFIEAEGHLTELQNTLVGWFHHICHVQNDLAQFCSRFYKQCVQQRYQAIEDPNFKEKVKEFLQGLYDGIPDFLFEMQDSRYDEYVRPPP
jgi:hypothetical protein